MKLLLEQFKKFLDEGAITDTSSLCLVIDNREDWVTLVIYKREEFLTNIKEFGLKDAIHDAVVSYIEIATHEPRKTRECYSEPPDYTWEVQLSASRHGYGPLMYDTALSLIVNEFGGKGLMADRGSVSQAARGLWAQWFKRGTGATGIKVKPHRLDEPPPRNQTDTTKDDCYIHEPEKDAAVDYLFTTKDNLPFVRRMKNNHKVAMQKIDAIAAKGIWDYSADDATTAIVGRGEKMFRELYEGSLDEAEPYQIYQRKKHPARKARLLTKGGNKTKVYPGKPSIKRFKSAPPGAGGS